MRWVRPEDAFPHLEVDEYELDRAGRFADGTVRYEVVLFRAGRRVATRRGRLVPVRGSPYLLLEREWDRGVPELYLDEPPEIYAVVCRAFPAGPVSVRA